jgi:hypothetical protein
MHDWLFLPVILLVCLIGIFIGLCIGIHGREAEDCNDRD